MVKQSSGRVCVPPVTFEMLFGRWVKPSSRGHVRPPAIFEMCYGSVRGRTFCGGCPNGWKDNLRRETPTAAQPSTDHPARQSRLGLPLQRTFCGGCPNGWKDNLRRETRVAAQPSTDHPAHPSRLGPRCQPHLRGIVTQVQPSSGVMCVTPVTFEM